jgi:hypothetical protein
MRAAHAACARRSTYPSAIKKNPAVNDQHFDLNMVEVCLGTLSGYGKASYRIAGNRMWFSIVVICAYAGSSSLGTTGARLLRLVSE